MTAINPHTYIEIWCHPYVNLLIAKSPNKMTVIDHALLISVFMTSDDRLLAEKEANRELTKWEGILAPKKQKIPSFAGCFQHHFSWRHFWERKKCKHCNIVTYPPGVRSAYFASSHLAYLSNTIFSDSMGINFFNAHNIESKYFHKFSCLQNFCIDCSHIRRCRFIPHKPTKWIILK